MGSAITAGQKLTLSVIDSGVSTLPTTSVERNRIVYVPSTHNGISNIWIQPLDGGPSKQLTSFQADRIFNFDWSRDGKWLALARGKVTDDIVLIEDQQQH